MSDRPTKNVNIKPPNFMTDLRPPHTHTSTRSRTRSHARSHSDVNTRSLTHTHTQTSKPELLRSSPETPSQTGLETFRLPGSERTLLPLTRGVYSEPTLILAPPGGFSSVSPGHPGRAPWVSPPRCPTKPSTTKYGHQWKIESILKWKCEGL